MDEEESSSALEEARCQIHNCTFCEHKGDGVPFNKEAQNLQSSYVYHEVTENPAYGLSTKHWLEISYEEIVNGEEVPNETMEPPLATEASSSEQNLLSPKLQQSDLRQCPSQQDENPPINPLSQSHIINPSMAETRHQRTDPSKESYNINPSMAETRQRRTDPPKESYSSQSCEDTRQKRIEPPKFDPHIKLSNDQHGGMSWSVLKHRQLDSADQICDKPNLESCDRPPSDRHPRDSSSKMNFNREPDGGLQSMDYSRREPPSREDGGLQSMDYSRHGLQSDISNNNKTKRTSAKDPRSFPLSLMKPKMAESSKKSSSDSHSQNKTTDISRQRPVQRAKLGRFSSDPVANSNPLSAIEQIKTEESIQEWLARISESTAGADDEDGDRSAWGTRRERQQTAKSHKLLRTEATNVLNKGLQEALEMSHGGSKHQARPKHQQPDSCLDEEEEEEQDGSDVLSSASQSSPASVPMVVMQCSKFHPHIGSKPPFPQKSLPMGTLVTALYQESDWMYVQTPHGVEGFIVAANCSPIGTVTDSSPTQTKTQPQTSSSSRRPWEPSDFPVEIGVAKRQQSVAKLATDENGSGNRQLPYLSTMVKMKSDFYSDRYFSHTFKSKDSIKTARTVTDILRHSPETKISNQ